MASIVRKGDKPLGKGSYGTVYSCLSRKGQRESEQAFKKNRVNKVTDFHVSLKELDVLVVTKKHPFIVSLCNVVLGEPPRDFCSSPTSSSGTKADLLHFTFEKATCSGDDLLDRRHPFYNSISATRIATHILLGLEFLHAKGIIHRDLKPGNILYFADTQEVKISDLGMCRRDTRQRAPTPDVCTLNYRAPEICIGDPYNEKSDIWSFGAMLYEFLTGELFISVGRRDGPEMIYAKILKKTNVKFKHDIPSEILPLLEGALKVDPKKRLSARELLALIPERYHETIQRCRENFPPVPNEEIPYQIATRKERREGAEILQEAASRNIKSRVLFHGWRLFDLYLFHLTPEAELDKKKVSLLLYVCFYLFEKYFATMVTVTGWDNFVPQELRGEENRITAYSFERQIIRDLCEMSIYQPTVFEACDNKGIVVEGRLVSDLLDYISTHDVSGLTPSEVLEHFFE